MAEVKMTEQQLAAYAPQTASGAALKERLEAAAGQGTEEPTPARRVLLR
jgi:hypothetical protein